MTEKRLKDAFGETPLSVQYRVKNALNGPKEGTIMKKKISVMLIAVVVYAVSIFVSRLFLKRIGKDRARVLSFFVAVGQVTLFAMPILSSV